MTEPLGLESRTVVVVPYDARWPVLFQDVASELASELGAEILGVHHVGSTAVPGLCAKPLPRKGEGQRAFNFS